MAIDVGGARGTQRVDLAQWPLVGRAHELTQLQHALAEHRGAVITGPVGIGKSTLAAAGVQFAREQGMAVTQVAGTEAARVYPFGAFASLLPHASDSSGNGTESAAEVLREYTRTLVDDAGGRPLLVVVDDAHLLDDASAMLVHQLSQTGAATVVACVLHAARSGGRSSTDPMVVLWKDYRAARIALGTLDDVAIEDLLTTVLGGPVDRAAIRLICERSQGDPVYLHELVVGAVETEVLREENGVWRLRGELAPTTRLIDLVNIRLGALSEAERHVLELTALGEPLAQPTLDELTEADAVESLEDKGFITSRMDGRRLQIGLSHPVLGDVIRTGISPRRERALAHALAESTGGRRQEDTLLLASLRLVGGGGSKELLLAGAQAARERRDIALSEKMARAAIDSGAGFDARYLAADAAHLSGRHDQAAQELAALAADAQTPVERARIALLQFDHAFWLTAQADLSDIDTLLRTVDEQPWRDELVARKLILAGLTQGPRAVLASVTTPLLRSADAPRTSLDAVVGRALMRTGRLHEAIGLLHPTTTDAVVPEATLTEPWSPFGSHALALVGLGWLSEAEDLLTQTQGDLSASPGSPEHAIVSLALGTLRLEQGRVQGAFLHGSSAAGAFLDLGLPVAARPCYALTASALALAGLAGKAVETLAELDALGLPQDMHTEVEVLQARAWTSVASGDVATARAHLELAVELGQETGDRLGTTRALHGLARMGRARQVADQLELLASHVDGPFTEARLCYTLATAAKNSAALEDAAEHFEEVGALLYAAEALGEAAVHYRRDGSSRDAAAAQQKAARLLARCEGAVTPFVRSIGARAQLTPAELDTALQAANGSTDKQIAELMHLSVRTVENRLHRAYQKLGLSHRGELAEALRDMPGA